MNVKNVLPPRGRASTLPLALCAGLLLPGCGAAPPPAAPAPRPAAEVRPALPVIPRRAFSLSDFGGPGDGRTLETAAFRAALAEVERAGGGRLVVPRGVHRTQPFALCSNLDLHLEEGAVIQAPGSFEAYGLPDPSTLRTQDEIAARVPPPEPLIHGKGLHDVAITGEGTIDGNGALWWAWSERAARNAARTEPGRLVVERPNLVVLSEVKRLLVAGVTLRDSPKFHLVPRGVVDLTIERVKVRAPFDAPNTDGIDPGPVTNAWIHHCDVDTGDDDIVLKRGAANVVVEDCTIRHGHGLSIGSGTDLGVRDVVFRRCTLDGTDNGIRIKSMRGAGGPVERIRYEELRMRGVQNAIVLDLTYVDNNRPNFKGEPSKVPSIREVVVERVTVEGSKNAGRIVGLPERRITGVTLEQVSIEAEKDLVVRDAEPPRLVRVAKRIRKGVYSARPVVKE